MKVGFIGLGTMGSSMALNVRAAGYDIVVNDIRREAGAAHLKAGASWARLGAQGGRGGRHRIHVAAGAERNRRGGARGGWITRRHAPRDGVVRPLDQLARPSSGACTSASPQKASRCSIRR